MVSSKNPVQRPAFKFGKKLRRPRPKNPEVEKNNLLLNLIWDALKNKIQLDDFKDYTFKAHFTARRIKDGYEIKNLKMGTKEKDA